MNHLQRVSLGLAVLLCTPGFLSAQNHGASPYQGQQQREIKALSPNDIHGLSNGEGMGLAKPAELNRYPGPSHVLQLAEQLNLSPEQRSAVRAIFERMKREAMAAGARIVALERELDQAFATRAIDDAGLRQRVTAIAALQGELRTIHLQAHLRTLPVLSTHQAHQYEVLRGYTAGDGAHGARQHGESRRH